MKLRHRSQNQHKFSQVPSVNIERSTFDRSHGHKTTFDAGYLVPVYVDEVLPGDTFHMDATVVARMATPIFPVMDNARMTVHFWAVPLRLLWENFEAFMGSVDPDGVASEYLTPQVMVGVPTAVAPGSLENYMGAPIRGLTDPVGMNAFHFRAYNLVWNEWYRDQNLQEKVTVNLDDGPDPLSDYTLLKRNKRHDYFTSCLPWPQKGPGVELPLGTSAPVTTSPTAVTTGSQSAMLLKTTAGAVPEQGFLSSNGSTGSMQRFSTISGTGGSSVYPANLIADLSNATASTINSLRQAFQLQRMFERDARGGTRYTELIQSHFNVVSPDARLQRPEFLGGGSVPVNISPTVQTSSTDATSPQGNLAAFATVSGGNIGFHRSFTEHCVIIGLVSVSCDLTYQQGLNRMWSRRTRFDYFWPALAHLGEQEVKNKEIYVVGDSADDETFGYQERYAEYRYMPSRISGLFSSEAAGSLDAWHYAQEFSDTPTLSSEFIEENPPLDRVLAVPSEPHFLFDSFFELKCERPMPVYSVPGMLDHF